MSFAVEDLGLIEYAEAWDYQKRLAQERIEGVRRDTLLLVRHPPVLTLGANFHEDNLLLPRETIENLGVQIERTDRGGDVTYHGPGQLVIYPIFDVSVHGKDLHKWMRDLEETMLLTVAAFGLQGRRFPPHTGVWIGEKKVAAIGVKIRRWVSMHGIALNCDADLSHFTLIVPCGIREYGVTSLSAECGRAVKPEDAAPHAVEAFRRVFGA